MSRALFSTNLVKSVRNRAMIPNDSATYTDDAILTILNEEIDAGMLSTLMTLNEEHLVTFHDVDIINGTKRYKIPYRAVGNKLRDVHYISSDGQREMTRVSLEEISDYDNNSEVSNTNAFYVEGDEIVLAGNNSDIQKLRMYFYMRPNVLVKENLCAKIAAINTSTGVITLSNFPSNFSNLPTIDFVQTRTPNKILKIDIASTGSNKNNKTITVAPANIPSDLTVGDYVCEAEQTPVPNCPTELHPLLAQRAAIFILEAMGDGESLALAKVKLAQMENSIQNILEDRVEGACVKINPRHSTLVQTSSKLGRRRGF